MSLKKLALIALIVVMLLSTIVFFGCKPKVQEEAVDTTMVETVDEVAPVVDTMMTEQPVTP